MNFGPCEIGLYIYMNEIHIPSTDLGLPFLGRFVVNSLLANTKIMYMLLCGTVCATCRYCDAASAGLSRIQDADEFSLIVYS